MKKQLIATLVAAAMLLSLAACGSPTTNTDTSGNAPAETKAAEPAAAATAAPASGDAAAPAGAPAEGKDTNNGRPYNVKPTKYDTRADMYLNNGNQTVLPIVQEPVTIDVWRSFNSTVMTSPGEGEAFKELEKRTNVKINWLIPPVGSEADNYNLRISSNDLPHIFSCPPKYPGDYAKAIDDGVYITLQEYYEKGWMPNVKSLRESREDINRDMVDDNGNMNFFPMVDIVPSDPWSGLWVRKDWLDEWGMQIPTTVQGWEEALIKMRDEKKVTPLQLRMVEDKGWYGIHTNYAFVGSYEAASTKFLNKDGKVVFGATEPGFKDYLTLMAKWYKDGLLDKDFATRYGDEYNANIADGKAGLVGLAYGEYGQIKLTGQSKDPKFNLVPVLQPTVTEGQTIHIHQDNSTVRGDREFLTSRVTEEKLEEVICRWKDYWYSQDGGDLMSYGPEGVSYKWLDNGEYEWIYPKLVEEKDSDFWTLYPLFKIHNFGYLRNSAAYEFEPEVAECIKLWDTQDSSWIFPDNIAFTTDESKELATIMTDVNTFTEETMLKIITGQAPVADWDKYVTQVNSMNLPRAIEINQAAIDRYNKR